jgi:hypothetical protein
MKVQQLILLAAEEVETSEPMTTIVRAGKSAQAPPDQWLLGAGL